MAGGPSIALERVFVRGRAAHDGSTLALTLTDGQATIEGARAEFQRLDARIGATSHVSWQATLDAVVGARINAQLRAAARPLMPRLASALERFRIEHFDTRGAAVVVRDASGRLVMRELDATHDVAAVLGEAALAAALTTRQTDSGPIEIRGHMKPVELGKLAALFPPEFGMTGATVSAGLDLQVGLSPVGELLAVDAIVESGRGQLGPVAPQWPPIAVEPMKLAVSMREKGARWEVAPVIVETNLGRLEASDVRLQHAASRATLTGRLTAANLELQSLSEALPSTVRTTLREIGLTPGDFTLPRCAAEFAAIFVPKNEAWQVSETSVTLGAQLGFVGQPVDLNLVARLPAGEDSATATLAIDELQPARFGPHTIGGIEMADLAFPLRVQAEARVGWPAVTLTSVSFRARAGPGHVRAGPVAGMVPSRQATIEGTFDVSKRTMHVPVVDLRLAAGLEARLENVNVAFAAVPRVAGRAMVSPVSFREALAWWPEKLFPDVRMPLMAAVRAGRLQIDALEFDATWPRPSAGKPSLQAKGGVEVTGLELRPFTHAPIVNVESARVFVDLPRAEVQINKVATDGFAIEAAAARIDDVLTATPAATLNATFTLEPARAAAWLEVGEFTSWEPIVRQTSGQVRGEIAVTAPLTMSAFDGAKAAVVLSSPRLGFPGWFEGPLRATFDAAGREGRALAATLHVDDLNGVPLRAKGMAQFRGDGPTLSRAEISELALGHSTVRAEWREISSTRQALQIHSPRLDVAELAGSFPPRAWLARRSSTSGPSKTAPAPAAAAISPRPAPISRQLDFKFEAAAIEFGGERNLRDVLAIATLENDWPQALELRATESDRNAIVARITSADAKQRFTFRADDTAALLRTLTAPVSAATLPAGAWADSVRYAAQYPVLFGGGGLEVNGSLARGDGLFAAEGTFELTNATLLRRPRLLHLLDAKSRHKLLPAPTIRRLSIGAWSTYLDAIAVECLALERSGLIDRLQVSAGKYEFAGEKLEIDGKYFRVPFEIRGTRAELQIYLKEISPSGCSERRTNSISPTRPPSRHRKESVASLARETLADEGARALTHSQSLGSCFGCRRGVVDGHPAEQ